MYVDPLFHFVTGGMMLGVFYMATDMVSSPMSAKGHWSLEQGWYFNYLDKGIWCLS